MRRIEKAMVIAIRKKENWAMDNTAVQRDDLNGVTKVTLHGNLIAKFPDDGDAVWTLAGWNTAVTRSRVNAIASEFSWPKVGLEDGIAKVNGNSINSRDWIVGITGVPSDSVLPALHPAREGGHRLNGE